MKRRNLLRKGGAAAVTLSITSIAGCSALQENNNDCEREGRTGEDCRLDRELQYPEWLLRNRVEFIIQRSQFTTREAGDKLGMIKEGVNNWLQGYEFASMNRTFPNVRLPNDLIVWDEGIPGVNHTQGYELGDPEHVEEVRADLSLEEVKEFLESEFPDVDSDHMGPILRATSVEIHTVEFPIEFPDDVTPGESDNAIANRIHEGPWSIMLSRYRQPSGHPQNPKDPGWLIV